MNSLLVGAVKGKVFNIVAFNLLWLGCVVGQNDFLWLTVPLLVSYLWFIVSNNLASFTSIALPATLGIAVDITLTVAGIFEFPESFLIIPFWLVVLWIGFASTLSQSLSFLSKRKWMAAIAGAAAFPFNYGVGERLGAVSFGETYATSIVVLALLWALLLPLCFYVSELNFKHQKGGENAPA